MGKQQLSDADIAELVHIQKVTKDQDRLGILPVDKSGIKSANQSSDKLVSENFIKIEGIPSQGYFYDGDLYGQSLKVNDLLLIQSIDDDNIDSVFDQIFTRRIDNIHSLNILTGDEYFLSLWLRATSYPGYNFSGDGLICDKCNYKMKNDEGDFNILDIEFKTSDINTLKLLYKDSEYIYKQITDKVRVGVCLRRRKHDFILNKYIDELYTKKGLPVSKDLRDIISMATILDLGFPDLPNGNLDMLSNVTYLTETIDVITFKQISKFVSESSFTCQEIVHHRCPKCNEITEIAGYPFRKKIYFPDNP